VSEKSAAEKMHMKAGHRVVTVNAPRFYTTLVGGLPDGARLVKGGEAEFVHLFVKDRAELDRHLAGTLASVGAETLFWISFPKQTSGLATDVTRDEGWKPVRMAGWEPVTVVSIDDTWSALRFKRHADIPARAARTPPATVTVTAAEPAPAQAPPKVETGSTVVPADFAAALAAVPGARARFDAMSVSHRREYVESIEEAKRPETRARRIEAMVQKIASDVARKG
jgi:Bacteriocin-protection, YdeI or OmpD-Associated